MSFFLVSLSLLRTGFLSVPEKKKTEKNQTLSELFLWLSNFVITGKFGFIKKSALSVADAAGAGISHFLRQQKDKAHYKSKRWAYGGAHYPLSKVVQFHHRYITPVVIFIYTYNN